MPEIEQGMPKCEGERMTFPLRYSLFLVPLLNIYNTLQPFLLGDLAVIALLCRRYYFTSFSCMPNTSIIKAYSLAVS